MKHDLSVQLGRADRLKVEITEIKPQTISELARIYHVDARTFQVWLAPFRRYIRPKRGRYYTVVQVEKIFTCVGMPKTISHDVG